MKRGLQRSGVTYTKKCIGPTAHITQCYFVTDKGLGQCNMINSSDRGASFVKSIGSYLHVGLPTFILITGD